MVSGQNPHFPKRPSDGKRRSAALMNLAMFLRGLTATPKTTSRLRR
jgi:hypothetical protein